MGAFLFFIKTESSSGLKFLSVLVAAGLIYFITLYFIKGITSKDLAILSPNKKNENNITN